MNLPAAAYTGKLVVYQVFTRLFGNQNSTNKPWGTLAENGVGKFAEVYFALFKVNEKIEP